MQYADIMTEAASLYNERGRQYGDMRTVLERTSNIASLIIGRTITPHEVALVLHAAKLARLDNDRMNPDNYTDGVNYYAFAGELILGQKRSLMDDVDDGVAALAAKFAPVQQEEQTP
jgi:hypothetical protein